MPEAVDFRPRGDAELAADLTKLPQWLAGKISRISSTIRHYRPAIVHSWLDVAGIAAALAACEQGVPRMIIQHGSIALTDHGADISALLWQAYQAVAGNPSVTMLNNSAAGAASYERWLGLLPEKIRVVYNGLALESLQLPSPEEGIRFRTGLGLSAETPVVGTVIRFVKEKDPLLWLATAAEIAKARPDVRFVLAGYGVLQDQIMQQIKALGLGDRVLLPGPVTDVGWIYSTFDVFLLTSAVEGLPNVLIEAQAAGCPVVSTDVGGAAEAVADGRTGRIVRERSPRRLAEAVVAILDDAAWRARVRSEGPAFVAGRFSLDRLVRETIAVYDAPPERRI